MLCFKTLAQVITFDSVKVVILSENPELEMYRQQAKSMEAMAEGARAWEAPQIGAGFFMTPYKTYYWRPQIESFKGMNEKMPGMGSFMIQGKQMIANPSRLKANQEYLKKVSSIETESGNANANKLLYDAKKLFSEIQIIDRKILILNEAEKTLETMITFGESKIAYNQEMLSNIYKGKSQKAQLQNESIMLENERKQKLYYLSSLMNRKEENLFEVDSQIVIKDYELSLVDTVQIRSNRSDILVLDNNINATHLKQKVERYKSRPDFGIEFGHMFAFGENPNQFTLMGMMSIPIAPWSSKMYRSNVLAYNHQIKAYYSQKQAILNESVGMIYGLKNEISSAKYQMELYKTMILPSLKKTYDLAMMAYAQNTDGLFVALDAQMNFQMAKIQYEDIILKLLLLQAEYEKQLQLF
ncbi:TolC family protein [Sporocytophaga myxococcoides]|nr:TolC family protein [Sporocytophaga myxococcoides]